MNRIIALLLFAGVSAGFSGCGQKAADPDKKTTVAKPDLGDAGSAGDMHDESKGKTTISKPAPSADDGKKPAPAEEPAAKDTKTEAMPAPQPADKAEKTDAKMSDVVDDTTDDKDEEEQQ
jgi:hypothetical protein